MIPSNQSKDGCKKVSLIVSIKNIPYQELSFAVSRERALVAKDALFALNCVVAIHVLCLFHAVP